MTPYNRDRNLGSAKKSNGSRLMLHPSILARLKKKSKIDPLSILLRGSMTNILTDTISCYNSRDILKVCWGVGEGNPKLQLLISVPGR